MPLTTRTRSKNKFLLGWQDNLIRNGVTDSEIWIGNLCFWCERKISRTTSSIHVYSTACSVHRRFIPCWCELTFVCMRVAHASYAYMHNKVALWYTSETHEMWRRMHTSWFRFFFAESCYFFPLEPECLHSACLMMWIMEFSVVLVFDCHWLSDETIKQ